MKYIPDGNGGFLTLAEIVEIVNRNANVNIKREDLSRAIDTAANMQPTAPRPESEESADYWRGKYEALKEIVEFADGDT